MNALSEDFWGTFDTKTAAKSGLFVRETHWGFIARQEGTGFEASVETVLKAVGLTLVPVGGALMFVLRDASLPGVALSNIGLPIAFIIIGLALFLHASRGFRREVQVDALDRQIRFGVANAQGSFCCRRTFAAREIDSAFLVRSRTPGRPSTLNLRLRGNHPPLEMLAAPEVALQPLLERTAQALKAPKVRKKRPQKRRMTLPLWKKRSNGLH